MEEPVKESVIKKYNINSIMIAVMLFFVVVVSIFIFCGGAKGKSAYQLACENGFKGTQAEWLESLKGKDGKDGKTVDYHALYTSAKESGEIESDTTYLQFIQSYIAKTEDGSQTKLLYAIQDSIKSSVSIVVSYPEGHETRCASGAGSIYSIDQDGNAYIITNYHVTYTGTSSRNIYIFLYEDSQMLNRWKLEQGNKTDSSDFVSELEADNNTIKGTYIGGSKTHDIAIIKVENNSRLASKYKNGDIDKVKLADPSKDLIVGSACYAVGNPFGEGISATQGIISVAYEQIGIQDVEDTTQAFAMRAIRVSCAINGGNSGGGLYNENGELIGVINSKRYYANKAGDIAEGTAFGIPLPVAKTVADKIIAECNGKTITKPTFLTIGITYTIDDCVAEYNSDTGYFTTKETISVESIVKDSYASKVNLQVGDKLVSAKIDYKVGTSTKLITLNHYYTLSDLILTVSKGDTLTLNVSRVSEYNNEQVITLTIKF